MITMDRAPEEYPVNLGIPRPEILRLNFDVAEIVRQATTSYSSAGHVSVLAFWGVGWREDISAIDRLGMAQLAMLKAHLQKALLRGVRLTLLMGDNHARANLIPDLVAVKYCTGIERLAQEFAFATKRLSEIYPLTGFPLVPTATELAVYAPLRRQFEGSAWRLRKADYPTRALQYFIVRYREAPAIAAWYPLAIFATADTPDRTLIAPRLPLLHIFAFPSNRLRQEKPWFLPHLEPRADASLCVE